MPNFFLLGDIYRSNHVDDVHAVADRINASISAGDVVCYLGDCAYDTGTAQEYADFKTHHIDRISGVDEKSRDSTEIALGNHENDFNVADQFWNLGGNRYYVNTHENVQVINIDSNDGTSNLPGMGATQMAWFQSILAVPFQGLRIVTAHHPYRSSSTRTNPDTYNNNVQMKPVMEAMRAGNVDLFFCAHVHTFEITKKVDGDFNPDPNGFRSVMAGTGGNGHVESFNLDSNALMQAPDGSGDIVIAEVTGDQANPNGYAFCSTDGINYSIAYIDRAGNARFVLNDQPLNVNSIPNPNPNPGTGAVNMIHGQWTQTDGNASTIVSLPYAAHTAAGRTGILMTSRQGPQHYTDAGLTQPSLTPPPEFTTELFNEGGETYVPGCGVFLAPLVGNEADRNWDMGSTGSAAFAVFEGALDVGGAVATSSSGNQVSYGAGLVVISLATNGNSVIAAPAGWTEIGTYQEWYSGNRVFWKSSDTAGSVSFTGAVGEICATALTIPELAVVVTPVVDNPVFPGAGVIGAGVGTDIGSGDEFGVTVDAPNALNGTQDLTLTVAGAGDLADYDGPNIRLDVGVPDDALPETEGYEFTAQVEEDDGTVLASADLGNIIGGEPKTTLEARVSGLAGKLTGTTWNGQIRYLGGHGLTSVIRPPAPPQPEVGSIFRTIGKHTVIDWWDWSHIASNNDIFGIKARATGGNEFWCDPNSGGGSGTQGSPWSPSQLKGQLDGRSLPAGSIVNMLPGEYNNKGLFGGENQLNGGGQGGGWVTLLGPHASVGVAKVTCTTDTRGVSMRAGSSKIQFVRMHCENTMMNEAFRAYVDNGGGDTSAGIGDPYVRGRIGGANPGGIGFQLDGYPSGAKPGPAVYVNCIANGWGEGFGSYQAGNAYTIGCIAYDSAWASPNGRSNFSFSWGNGGRDQTPASEDAISSPTLGHSYFGGAFACLSFHAFQLHPSSGIDNGTNNTANHVTDGNGLILPTDGFNNERGRFFHSTNIIYGIGGAGSTGFEGCIDGQDKVNNTVFQTGWNGLHTQSNPQSNPFNLPLGLIRGKSGSGPAFLEQRYVSGRISPNLSNNIAINGPHDGRSLQAWQNIDVQGTGNIFTDTPRSGENATVGSIATIVGNSGIIAGDDPFVANADAALVANSPAIGAGYLDRVIFPIDFMGNPLIDRGGGRCDAGALQHAGGN